MDWLKEWGIHELATKGVGLLASVVASHLLTLTTTPEYAHFWSQWGLSAPTVINKTVFEAKLTAVLAFLWIAIDHFFWKIANKPKNPQS